MAPSHLAGKIKCVSVRNFVTYEQCVFNPNEYLNIIIGPNGTGKSTLVAAIVIGFGGDPKLLSRSSAIQDYIRNGKTEATVIIQIYQTNNKSSIMFLERSFNADGKSEFKVNGETMSKTKFLAEVAQFKIQIGNLCQFLPQDRVQDFAKMNPQELFANTIKSVCNQDELKKFEEMKSLRSEQESRKYSLVRESQNLHVITERLEELKIVLERYTQRKEYEDKLKASTAKYLWLEVEELRTKLASQEMDKREAENIHKKVETEFNKIRRKQENITTTKSNLKADADRKRAISHRIIEETNELTRTIEALTMKIKNGKRTLEHRKREYTESKQEIGSESAILEGIAQDVKDVTARLGNLNDLKSQLNPLNERMMAYRSEISKRMETCSSINNRLDEEYTSHIRMLKNRIERDQNVKDLTLQMLRSKFQNVFAAVQWLQQNGRKFRGKVYNPMILELNIKVANHAKYAENTIPLRDLLAITCEEKSDMSLIVEELCVKQKLGINCLYSPPANSCDYRPSIPIENLSKYGFESYLIDSIEGPPCILNYLCSFHNIHQIPIGGNQVSCHTEDIPKSIQRYYGGNNRYECTISRYSGEASLIQNPINAKQLLMSINTQQVEAMKKELSKLLYKSDSLKNQCTKIQSEIKDIEVECEEIRNEKRSIENKLLLMREAIVKFERQKKKVQSLKNNLIDLTEAENEFLAESAKTIKKILKLQNDRLKSLETYQKAVSQKRIAEVKVTVYNQQSEDLESKLNEISERRRTAKQTMENVMRAVNITEKKIEDKSSKAKEASNGRNPEDRNFPYKNEFRNLPNTIAELRDHINEFNARLECMTDVNENLIRENEEKTAELERIKSTMNDIQMQEKEIEEKIKNLFDAWYSNIARIVDILNQKFTNFMQSMGFVGEISLARKEMYDFESYGIQIMVQYRKEVPLQILDRSRQSGGERAVAIAVYSLSLQHLTNVPFRCVDEINQGMDPRNERKIFEMLVQETTKTGRSQYFFVTPKLLPGLVHSSRMMVHIVYNGKFVKSGDYI